MMTHAVHVYFTLVGLEVAFVSIHLGTTHQVHKRQKAI